MQTKKKSCLKRRLNPSDLTNQKNNIPFLKMNYAIEDTLFDCITQI